MEDWRSKLINEIPPYEESDFNCKFEVLSSDVFGVSEGMVFEVVNGRFFFDDTHFPLLFALKSEEELIEYMCGKFERKICFMPHFDNEHTDILILKENEEDEQS